MADTTTSSSSSSDDDRGPWRVSVQQHDPERFPYALARGVEANLSAVRASCSDAQTRATFFEERNTNTVALEANAPALLWETPLFVEATMRITEGGEPEIVGKDDNDNDEGEGDENGEGSSSPTLTLEPERRVPGQVFVTNTQVLFVATDTDDSDSDLAIGGACVVLHAMTEDPEPSVYLQLSSEDHVDTGGVTEVTLIPSTANGGGDGDGACQALFDALCKLISLHPIEGDDEDEEGGGMFGFGGGMIGGGFGDDVYADYGEPADADGHGDADGLVWAPPAAATGGEATPAERQAMLDRLDDMLVVAPGLQVDETGQFDDAPES